MNSDKEITSSRMACVEVDCEVVDEDLDMEDGDFQVVDCWEDEGDDEIEPSQTTAKFSDSHKELRVLNPSRDSRPSSRKSLKETKLKEHVPPTNANKTGKSSGVICLNDTSHSQTSKAIPRSAQNSSNDYESKNSVLKINNNEQTFSKEEKKPSNSAKSMNKDKKISKSNEKETKRKTENRSNEHVENDAFDHNVRKCEKSKVVDSTETKVENFLREMALQHPQVNNLDGVKPMKHSSDSVFKTSKKSLKDEAKAKPKIDPSDLPPGVDLDQVAEDTSTSKLLAASEVRHHGDEASEQNEIQLLWASTTSSVSDHKISALPQVLQLEESSAVKPHRIDGRLYADYSKIIPKDTSNWCKSSHKSYQTGLSKNVTMEQGTRSSARNYSTSPSRRDRSPTLSLSPSPPRFYQQFPTTSAPIRVSHLPSLENSSSHKPLHKFVQHPRHLNYRSPSPKRNYSRKSRESSILRALSRSLSKERVCHRSRSRSRPRSSGIRHPGRKRSNSIEERHRKVSSLSRSRSPSSRIRSRNSLSSISPSPERHRYRRDRSSSSEENIPKKQRVSSHTSKSRSRSRGRSPWRPPVQVQANEWYGAFSAQNGSSNIQDEVRLEHDMERFIATNMAATGQLRQPVVDWLEASHGNDLKLLPDPTMEVMDQPMPLPPPPPDISELMKSDDVLEDDVQVIPDQNVSLSSLLESAVSGVPSQAVIDRCQDAIMKLHDVGIKQGRLNIISESIEPLQPTLISLPWQSILHRPNPEKIFFSFSKQPENPVLWEVPSCSHESLRGPLPHAGSHEPTYPQPNNRHKHGQSGVQNSCNAEHTALLQKIAFLTKELYEIKQLLDSKEVLKISVAVQTEPNFLPCIDCEKRKEFSAGIFQKTPQSHSSLRLTSILPAPPLSIPAPPLSIFSLPRSSSTAKPFGATESDPQSAPASSLSQSLPSLQANPVTITSQTMSPSAPQPVPPPSFPVQCFTPQPRLTSGLSTIPGSLSTFYPNKDNLSRSWSSNVPNMATVTGVKSSSSPGYSSSSSQASKWSAGGDWRNISEKAAPKAETSKKPVAPAVAPAPKSQKVVGIVDYEIAHHQMVGDEHLFDLVAFLSTTGSPISVDPKYCSPSLTVDKFLSLFSSKSGVIKSQIIIMVGVYNNFNTNWDAYLKKYTHLVGFLRKRCSHLVLVEPPPIPRLINSLPYWESVKALSNLFKSFKTDNVSVVLTHHLLMSCAKTPNPAFYVNDKRLSGSGLQIIADELKRVLNLAKEQKKGKQS